MLKSGKRKVIGLSLLLALLVTLMIPTQAVFADDGDEWPQFQKDPQHSGYSTSTAPDIASLKWASDDINANSSSSLAVADGKVFSYCFDSGAGTASIIALDQADGSVVWEHAIEPSGVWGSWSTPAYHDGHVFMATDGIYCLDAGDGHEVWSYIYPSGLSTCDGSVTVADGKVIAGDWDTSGGGSTYYCVSESTGALIWDYDVPGYGQGTPAYHDGKFFLTSWEYPGGNVFCVNADDGATVWHSDGIVDGTYNYNTCGSVCVAAGKVFFTTYNFNGDGELMALNESDGSVAWGPVTIMRTDSTPAYLDGRVYVCGGCSGYSDSATYCFDASDGSLVWETPGLGNWTYSVAVADGKCFVGGAGGFFDSSGICALDIANGNEVWCYEGGGATAAVAGGMVYTIGEGQVWAFCAYVAWDVNRDGHINVSDLILVGKKFGQSGSPGWIPEDVNSDGHINVSDFIIIGQHFGE